jgi:hypothetical protein
MATKKSIYIWILFGILITAAWLLGSVTQAGAQTYTMKGRSSHHVTKAHAIEVGDVPGHNIFLFDQSGLFFQEDGQVAILSVKGVSDYTQGSGPAQGYWLNTYEDGSTTCVKWKLIATAAPDGKTTSWEGTFEYIKGTGRFEGIKGGGSFTGKRFAPLPGAGAEIYNDFTGTYTLHSR